MTVEKQRYDEVSADVKNAFLATWKSQGRYKSPFLSPDFAELIHSVRQDVDLVQVWDADEPKGFFPLHLGFGDSAVGIGGPFSDRNGPLFQSGFQKPLSEILAASRIRTFTTEGLISDELEALEQIEIEPSYVTVLDADFKSFADKQQAEHGKFFKTMRRRDRKLHNEHSEIVFTFDDRREETFQALIQHKRNQFAATNRHDVLEPQWVVNMLDRLRNGFCEHITPVISSIYVDGQFMAGELNLRHGSLLHGWIVVYNPDFHVYSPGTMIYWKIMSEMLENGIHIYDAGIYSGHYKKYLSNQIEPVGLGSVQGCKGMNIVGNGWSFLEKHSPDKISENLGKIRRRSNQIMQTEVEFDRKVAGFAKAFKAIGKGGKG